MWKIIIWVDHNFLRDTTGVLLWHAKPDGIIRIMIKVKKNKKFQLWIHKLFVNEFLGQADDALITVNSLGPSDTYMRQ